MLKKSLGRAVVAHTFNPSTLGGRGRRISELEASLVYRVSSRTARATQRNHVLKDQKKEKKKKRKEKKLKLDFCYSSKIAMMSLISGHTEMSILHNFIQWGNICANAAF